MCCVVNFERELKKKEEQRKKQEAARRAAEEAARAKKREEEERARIVFNNTTIREAVTLWFSDKTAALNRYGHISKWNTSNVTDMSALFNDFTNKSVFLFLQTNKAK